jgi:hypothetical protein
MANTPPARARNAVHPANCIWNLHYKQKGFTQCPTEHPVSQASNKQKQAQRARLLYLLQVMCPRLKLHRHQKVDHNNGNVKCVA